MKKTFLLTLLITLALFWGCKEENSIVEPSPQKMDSKEKSAFCPNPNISSITPNSDFIVRIGSIPFSLNVTNLSSCTYSDLHRKWNVEVYIDNSIIYDFYDSRQSPSNGSNAMDDYIAYNFSRTISNLGRHWYRVEAKNYWTFSNIWLETEERTEEATFIVRPNTPPSAPSITLNEETITGSTSISWGDVTNGKPEIIDGYRIYRSMDGGAWEEVGSTSSNQTYFHCYLFSTVCPRVVYQGTVSYKVVAYDQDMVSGLSNTVSFNYGQLTGGDGFY